MRVALFATCLADSFFAGSALAAARILEALGLDVSVPRAQTCCGQPAFNTGHWTEARAMARHTLAVLGSADAVVLPSGSCAAMIRCHYARLCAARTGRDSGGGPEAAVSELAARTWELTEFIVRVLGVTELGDGLRGRRVAWHHGCHALRELHVRDEPLTLLRNAGATLVDWDAAEECCGFGGAFAVKLPEVSVAMADSKIASLTRPGAGEGEGEASSLLPIDVLTSTDAGCLLQLEGRLRRRGFDLPVRHVADLLQEAMGTSAAVSAPPAPAARTET